MPDNEPQPPQVHWPDCWRLESHWMCARNKIVRLTNEKRIIQCQLDACRERLETAQAARDALEAQLREANREHARLQTLLAQVGHKTGD